MRGAGIGGGGNAGEGAREVMSSVSWALARAVRVPSSCEQIESPCSHPRGRIVLYKCSNAVDQGVLMGSVICRSGASLDEVYCRIAKQTAPTTASGHPPAAFLLLLAVTALLLTLNATLFSLSEKGGSARSTGCAVRGVHGSGVSGARRPLPAAG
ncbi:hypothetical protein EV126DRAFT_426836 [Verticillium dahliae]|nr:hypothetical protein EV126DRAFT_435472 [Verticillium dahliae]KAH6696028.1 hypothetical protein EV126DRAFT_426836 [Verticillium dahliae]